MLKERKKRKFFYLIRILSQVNSLNIIFQSDIIKSIIPENNKLNHVTLILGDIQPSWIKWHQFLMTWKTLFPPFLVCLVEVLAGQPCFYFKISLSNLVDGLAIVRVKSIDRNIAIGFSKWFL